MVSDDVIEYWVKIVNDEIGRSDRNEQSIDYFKKIRPFSKFVYNDRWYLVMMPTVNMWGDKILAVVSCYVKKDFRKNPRNFLEIQREIKKFANEKKVRYIIQGSHINKDYYKFLVKLGYQISEMRKEI